MLSKRLLAIGVIVLTIIVIVMALGGANITKGQNSPTLTSTLSADWPIITPTNAHQITLLAILVGAEPFSLSSKDGTAQAPWIEDIAFSPDSALLATIDPWGIIILWNSKTATELSLLSVPSKPNELGNANRVIFSPDGGLLASSGGADIYLWDVNDALTMQNPTPITVLKGHNNGVQVLVFSPDGTILASSDRGPFRDNINTVRLWEVSTGRALMIFDAPGYGSCCLHFSPNGHIFYWTDEEVNHEWLMEDQVDLGTSDMPLPLLSPDGSTRAIWVRPAKGGYIIQLQDVITGEVKVTLRKDNGPIGEIAAFSPDGTILATGYTGDRDAGINLWEVASGNLLTHIDGPGAIAALSFSPDGTLLADGEASGRLVLAGAHIWRIRP